MDLQIEDDPVDIERARQLIADREAALLLREGVLARERLELEEAKKNLAALECALGALVSSLEKSTAPKARRLDLLNELDREPDSSLTTSVAYGEIKKAIREAIANNGQARDFTVRDVMNFLALQFRHINIDSNRSNISSYLRDFVSEGLIEIQQEGSGQRPTIYRKK